MRILAVFCGGVVGGMLREILTHTSSFGRDFVWLILLVNLLGCLLLGCLTHLPRHPSGIWRIGVTVGLCGGFTTFAEAMSSTLSLFQQRPLVALAGVVGSVIMCGASYALGKAVSHRILYSISPLHPVLDTSDDAQGGEHRH